MKTTTTPPSGGCLGIIFAHAQKALDKCLEKRKRSWAQGFYIRASAATVWPFCCMTRCGFSLASLQKGQNWAGLMTGGCFGEGGALEAAGVLGVRVFVSRGVEP